MEYLYLDRTSLVFNNEKKVVLIKLNKGLIQAKRDKSAGYLYHKLDLEDVNSNKAEMTIPVEQIEEDKIDFQKMDIVDGNIFYNEFNIFLESPYFKKGFLRDQGEKSCKFYKEFYNIDIDNVYQFNILGRYENEVEPEIKKFVGMVHEFKNKILEHPKITMLNRYKKKILENKPIFIKNKDSLVIKEQEKTEEIGGAYKILLKPIIRTVSLMDNIFVDNVVFLICKIYERGYKNPFDDYLFDDEE